MIPSRDLDALVAEKVMGLPLTAFKLAHADAGFDSPGPDEADFDKAPAVEPYSTDISAAWEVLTCDKWTWILEEMDDDGRVSCFLENEDEDIWARVIADTAPHAICLAALKTVGVNISENS